MDICFQENVNPGQKTRITDLKPKMKECFDWLKENQLTWTKILLMSCVIAIIIDPLFFYIPLINEDMKCLRMDQQLMIIVIVFRSFTDIFGILNIGFKVRSLAIRKSAKFALNSEQKKKKIVFKSYTSGCIIFIIIDILAILPLPHVLILVVNAKMWSSTKYWTTMRILNFVALSQNLPRILQIYNLCMELKRSRDSITGHVCVKGAFNLALYVVASHIFGACWYYFSIQRVTTCWQRACRSYEGCVPDAFSCHVKTSSSDPRFNVVDFCPVNPPNATKFDFGIFVDALESGLVGRTDFPIKFLQCFWWGLRNLSSLGQNLETSSDLLETCFAILISIMGLLLFLYLIGNLQTYMLLETTRSYENGQKMKNKVPKIEKWVSENCEKKRDKIKREIMRELEHALKEEENFDLGNLLIYLTSRISEEKDENSAQGKNMPRKKLSVSVGKLKDYISDWKKQTDQMKEDRAKSWMSANEIPEEDNIRNKVMQYLSCGLYDNKDVDIVKVLSLLPCHLGTNVKERLCSPILEEVIKKLQEKQVSREDIDMESQEGIRQEVPQEEDKNKIICHLKPMIYNEGSYIIRKGEPLDFMLFITQGDAWSFTKPNYKLDRLQTRMEKSIASTSNEEADVSVKKSTCNIPVERLKRKSCYGEELLKWILDGKPGDCPISRKNVKSHTKVEAFVLKAIDLEKIFDVRIAKKKWLKLREADKTNQHFDQQKFVPDNNTKK